MFARANVAQRAPSDFNSEFSWFLPLSLVLVGVVVVAGFERVARSFVCWLDHSHACFHLVKNPSVARCIGYLQRLSVYLTVSAFCFEGNFLGLLVIIVAVVCYFWPQKCKLH